MMIWKNCANISTQRIIEQFPSINKIHLKTDHLRHRDRTDIYQEFPILESHFASTTWSFCNAIVLSTSFVHRHFHRSQVSSWRGMSRRSPWTRPSTLQRHGYCCDRWSRPVICTGLFHGRHAQLGSMGWFRYHRHTSTTKWKWKVINNSNFKATYTWLRFKSVPKKLHTILFKWKDFRDIFTKFRYWQLNLRT